MTEQVSHAQILAEITGLKTAIIYIREKVDGNHATADGVVKEMSALRDELHALNLRLSGVEGIDAANRLTVLEKWRERAIGAKGMLFLLGGAAVGVVVWGAEKLINKVWP